MFIGFNLQLDEDANIFGEEYDYLKLQELGRDHLNDQKACYETDLREYVKQNKIDGTKIQNEWFPEISADIFISHSHNDEELACALAGWINHKFGLQCFIDSNVWGYSAELLDEMNSQLSNKRENCDGGYLYDYQSCNQVSQHVNTMLSIALQKMIDKVETVIFLNTDNAVKVYKDTEMEETYSPWIYSEIVCTQLVRKKPLLAYRDYSNVRKEYSAVYESAQFLMHSAISYTVSLKHLKTLSEWDLNDWDIEYLISRENYKKYPLDALYKFVCLDEMDSTKNLFARLPSSEIEALQKAYSIQNMNSEEEEDVQSVWKDIMDRYLRNCLECKGCRYMWNE